MGTSMRVCGGGGVLCARCPRALTQAGDAHSVLVGVRVDHLQGDGGGKRGRRASQSGKGTRAHGTTGSTRAPALNPPPPTHLQRLPPCHHRLEQQRLVRLELGHAQRPPPRRGSSGSLLLRLLPLAAPATAAAAPAPRCLALACAPHHHHPAAAAARGPASGGPRCLALRRWPPRRHAAAAHRAALRVVTGSLPGAP